MIDAVTALCLWLEGQRIDPTAVKITLSADHKTAEKIAMALGRIANDLSKIPSRPIEPVRSGTIMGMNFGIDAHDH